MNNLTDNKRYSKISYISLVVGIICFFIVFVTPTRIANSGSLAGDYITIALTGLGMLLSILAMTKKTEKKAIPLISLILSSSFFMFWIIVFISLFTGLTEFAP